MILPKVCIIVPVYNAEPYIRECIASLISQTYQNLEIICVDDGSEDDSLLVLQKMKKTDSRIHVSSQKNKGLSAARNIALGNTSADYVMFCDSDDSFERNAVELCVKECLSHPESEAVLFNARMFSANGVSSMAIHGEQYANMPHVINCERSEFLGTFANVCFGFFSLRTIKENNLTFREGHIYEDWEFAGHFLSVAKKVIWLNAPLYNYRWNQAVSISKDVTANCLDIFDTIERVEKYYKAANRWNNVQFVHYIRVLTHLVSFQQNQLLAASTDVAELFSQKTREYVQNIPYVMLVAVVCFIPMEQRIALLSIHGDADVELQTCKKNLWQWKMNGYRQRLRGILKRIMRNCLPAYRVATHTRWEMEAMNARLQAQLETVVWQQMCILNDLANIKEKIGLEQSREIIQDINRMSKGNLVMQSFDEWQ